VAALDLATGLSAQIRRTVTQDDTALALGSGDLDVLATPRLLAWCEQATLAVLDGRLPGDQTSVGSRVELVHQRGSRVGVEVAVRAVLGHADGRLIRFDVVAEQAGADGSTAVVGRALVTRVVVDRERFLCRL